MKGFYHICAWWPSWSCDLDHLYKLSFPLPKEAPHKIHGHVTRIMLTNFHFLVPESFHTKFSSNGQVVSEKIWFEFLHVHDLGPRSSNDLDLQYSHTFMKSISCLYLPTFRSQVSMVSEKSTVFTFSNRKA